MTGKRKNEQSDIVTQAQIIVDEYEKKYFSYLNDAFANQKASKKSKKALLIFLLVISLAFVGAIKILL